MNRGRLIETLRRKISHAKGIDRDFVYITVFQAKEMIEYLEPNGMKGENTMNSLHIIGNLTNDPELRTTQSGKEVCNFTVAVNRRKTAENPDPGADFFRVSAWGERGKVCKKYLAKGRKVSVVGPVSVRVFSRNDGEPGASLEIKADDIEFLTSKGGNVDAQTGYEKVEPDDMPY